MDATRDVTTKVTSVTNGVSPLGEIEMAFEAAMNEARLRLRRRRPMGPPNAFEPNDDNQIKMTIHEASSSEPKKSSGGQSLADQPSNEY